MVSIRFGIEPDYGTNLWGYGLVQMPMQLYQRFRGPLPPLILVSDTDEPVLHDIECRALKMVYPHLPGYIWY